MTAPGPHDSRFLQQQHDLLRGHSTATTAAACAAVLLRQQQDFGEGRRRRVEDYLADNPSLADDASALRRLVLNEALLRYEAGEELLPGEYEQRFPGLADQLPAIFFLVSAAASRPPSAEPAGDLSTRVAPPGGLSVNLLAATVRRPQRQFMDLGPADWPRIEGYTILGPLGRGGMGVVYKARQERLGRVVALKMVRDAHPAPAHLARFLAEARRSAALEHPNIVRLYEAGEQEGQPYFTMEFVDGPSLHDHLADKPQDPAAAAALMEVLARAIHFAHGKGIVHRDLKPGNIMLQAQGSQPLGFAVPKVADFGLATSLDPDARQTVTGAILGTPPYMAPEQAAGHTRAIGPATDTYALGAILYECLIGRPPFLGSSTPQLLEQVRLRDPVAPRAINPAVPLDLETICLACLEKEPQRRYSSAEALADDLRRYLDGKPIVRRPLRWWGRALKYARRHPARAGVIALGTAAAAMILGFALFLIYTQAVVGNLLQQREEAVRDRDQARADAGEAERGRDQATTAAGEAEQKKVRAEDDLLRVQGEERKARAGLRRANYLTSVTWGRSAWEENDIVAALRLLEEGRPGEREEDLRGFEWYHLWKLCHSERLTFHEHKEPVVAVGLTSDGRTAVSLGGRTDTPLVWDTITGRMSPAPRLPPAKKLALSQDGKSLALVVAHDLIRIQPPGAAGPVRLIQRRVSRAVGAAHLVAQTLAANGTAPAGPTLALDLAAVGAVVPTSLAPDVVSRIALTADGNRLAVATSAGTVEVWDVATGLRRTVVPARGSPVTAVVFSANGEALATGDQANCVAVWDLSEGKWGEMPRERWRKVLLAGFNPAPPSMTALGFSSVGLGVLASAGEDGVVRLHDTRTGGVVRTLGGNATVRSLSFSANGTEFAFGGDEGSVSLWDVAPGGEWKERHVFKGHVKPVYSVCFAAGGRSLASSGSDGTVKVWDWRPEREGARLVLAGHKSSVHTIAVSADGTVILTAALGDPTLLIHDATGGPLRRLTDRKGIVCAALSRDGTRAASVNSVGALRLWDAAVGQLLWEIQVPGGFPQQIALSPDGKQLALVCAGEGIRLCKLDDKAPPDLAPGRPASPFRDFLGLAFRPDGERLAFASQWLRDHAGKLQRHYGVRVSNPDGEEALDLDDIQSSKVLCLAYSPDGTLLAWGREDGVVTLTDAVSKKGPRDLRHHAGPVRSVAFSPDGKALATAADDVKLWDPATGEERCTLPRGHEQLCRKQRCKIRTYGDEQPRISQPGPRTRPAGLAVTQSRARQLRRGARSQSPCPAKLFMASPAHRSPPPSLSGVRAERPLARRGD